MQISEHADINITPTAEQHIRNQLAQTQASYLRLGIKESGCNGYMYMLDFLDEPAADDHCFEFSEGVQLCVRDADLVLVQGTEVDMITEGLNSALVFKNPNATSYCGCGESFAVASADNTDNAGITAEQIDDLATDVGSPGQSS